MLFYRAKWLDSRLRGNDRRFGLFVIPAEAGIQVHYPDLLRSYRKGHRLPDNTIGNRFRAYELLDQPGDRFQIGQVPVTDHHLFNARFLHCFDACAQFICRNRLLPENALR